MNRKTAKWVAPLIALGLLAGIGATSAVAADTGNIKGAVTSADGKAVEGTVVRLMKPQPKAAAAADDSAGGKPTPIATATTDAEGKFEMKDIPVGTYFLTAGDRHSGMGREKVALAAGQTEEVTLALQPAGEKPAGKAKDGEKKEKGKKAGKKNKNAEEN